MKSRIKKRSAIKVKSFLRKSSKGKNRRTRVKSYCRLSSSGKTLKKLPKKVYHKVDLHLRFQLDKDWISRVNEKVMEDAAKTINKKVRKISQKRDFDYFITTERHRLIINITTPCATDKTLHLIVGDLLNLTFEKAIELEGHQYDIYVEKMDILA